MTTNKSKRESNKLKRMLAQFSFDDPPSDPPFAIRLAEENEWSEQFTLRAIEEYKRFLFLAVNCGFPVVPSMVVDQVWHLHLIYTRSYWDELCGRVLGCPIHHQPSPGGAKVRDGYNRNYRATLENYAKEFGTAPGDIWPGLEDESDSKCERAI